MNSVVEKLAAIEKEVAAVQPKMAPLTERIADLDQKVAGFAQQLTGLAEESASVKQDIELTRQSLTRIQALIGESKIESEQLVAGQAENLQRCETMTAVFGAAFQAVSQFFETAQRMGLADQAKAVFLHPPGDSPPLLSPQALGKSQSEPLSADSTSNAVGTASGGLTAKETAAVAMPKTTLPKAELPGADEKPQVADVADNAIETVAVETVDGGLTAKETPEAAMPKTTLPKTELPGVDEKPQVADVADNAVETVAVETAGGGLTATETPEAALSEADFDSAIPGAEEGAPDALLAPSLPNVAATPDIASTDPDSGEEGEEAGQEPSSEIASQLEVPPLNLATPDLPKSDESAPETEEADDQEIDDLLTSMMTPVTATAGN